MTEAKPKLWIEKWAIGVLVAGLFANVGVQGILRGKTWVPERHWNLTGEFGAYFSGSAGLIAASAYLIVGALIHYIFFWIVPRQRSAANDPIVFILVGALALAIFAFVFFALAN